MSVSKLHFTVGERNYNFTVEVAQTEEERKIGLMHRYELAADHGMLFDLGTSDDAVGMWMKNTYIPLDIIFLDDRGKVLSIAKNTTPLSRTIIPAPRGARYAVELNAGTANAISLTAGNTAHHPLWLE